MNERWVVKIGKDGYASDRYYGIADGTPGWGRPIVKSRDKAIELTDKQCQHVPGVLKDILSDLKYRGVKLKDISVCSADPDHERWLRLDGWWCMFSTFSKKN